MSGQIVAVRVVIMKRFLLHHEHEASQCGVAFAAWRGFPSRLRHGTAIATCPDGGHEIWFLVEAAAPGDALRQLPPFLAVRTQVIAVHDVPIP
jgi:hypothetical protein